MRRPRIPWASSRACVSPVPFISSPGAPNEQNHQLAEPIGVERMGRSTPENDQLYSARTFATWRRVSTNAIWHSTRSPRRPRLSWSIRPRSRSRSPWSNSTPDFHVPRRQIDCQLSKLGDGEIGSVKKRDQFLLSWLAEDDPIGGKLSLQAPKCFDLSRIGQQRHMAIHPTISGSDPVRNQIGVTSLASCPIGALENQCPKIVAGLP